MNNPQPNFSAMMQMTQQGNPMANEGKGLEPNYSGLPQMPQFNNQFLMMGQNVQLPSLRNPGQLSQMKNTQ